MVLFTGFVRDLTLIYQVGGYFAPANIPNNSSRPEKAPW
jgi:hypothetical protein